MKKTKYISKQNLNKNIYKKRYVSKYNSFRYNILNIYLVIVEHSYITVIIRANIGFGWKCFQDFVWTWAEVALHMLYADGPSVLLRTVSPFPSPLKEDQFCNER